MPAEVALLGVLLVVALASRQIGEFVRRLGLPLISGFLAAGLLVGPFALAILGDGAAGQLAYFDDIALGFIAIAAGAELFWKDLRGSLRSIAGVITIQTVVVVALCAMGFAALVGQVPALEGLGRAEVLAASLLVGTIMVARSPSSAYAVIKEVGARGPFTRKVLGVTVLSDALVIVLFAGGVDVARVMLTEGAHLDFQGAMFLIAEIGLDIVAGIVLGVMLGALLALKAPRAVKSLGLLAVGWFAFALSTAMADVHLGGLPLGLFGEPLLVCLVAGLVVANGTGKRAEMHRVVEATAMPVFVVFFTLVGAGLEVDVLVATWAVALLLVLIRAVGLAAGSVAGGLLGGDSVTHGLLMGPAFITQAGVSVGLAREVGHLFEGWGPTVATLLIGVIVINQVMGPPLMKWALGLAGETGRHGAGRNPETPMEAVIFGVEPDTLAIARRLERHGWIVRLADTDPARLEGVAVDGAVRVDLDDPESFAALRLEDVDTVVGMLPEDGANLVASRRAHEAGVRNFVVPLHDRDSAEEFRPLGAHLLDPHEAYVHLIEHYVRTPTAAGMLLGMEEGHDTAEVTILDRRWQGVALRDVRLPEDVLVLSLWREGHHLTVRGTTRFELGDRVTVLGSHESIERVAVLFGD